MNLFFENPPVRLLSFLILTSSFASARQVTVTNAGSHGPNSLRDALSFASPGDEIVFLPTLNGKSISLGGQELVVSKPVTIDASALSRGITLDATRRSRVLRTSAAPTPVDLSQASAVQSSDGGFPASRAIDGDLSNFTHTRIGDLSPSLTVTFPGDRLLGSLTIFNRADCCQQRLRDLQVTLLDRSNKVLWSSAVLNPGNHLGYSSTSNQSTLSVAFPPLQVRKVTISRKVTNLLAIDENVLSIGELKLFSPGVVLNNITVTGGRTTVIGGDDGKGGGVLNEGALTLINSRVIGNTTHPGEGGAVPGIPGGGIFNGGGGILAIHDSTLQANSTGAGGDGDPDGQFGIGSKSGGLGGAGGAIYNAGVLYVTNSTLARNHTGEGGRGRDSGAGGSAGSGAAIFNGGFLSLANSTLALNKTGQGGLGGGNGGDGAAICQRGMASIQSATIARNAAGKGRSPGRDGEGGGIFCETRTFFANSIIADNSTSAPGADLFEGGESFVRGGRNIVGNLGGTNLIGDGELKVVDPKLRPLAEYGGPTETMPPHSSTSLGLDLSSSLPIPTKDQRGQDRVGIADLGAVEFQGDKGEFLTAFDADSDGDGVPNGVEAAIGTDPFKSDLKSRFHLRVFPNQNRTGMEIGFRYERSDIPLKITHSSDLVKFTTILTSGKDFGPTQANGRIVFTLFPKEGPYFRLEATRPKN